MGSGFGNPLFGEGEFGEGSSSVAAERMPLTLTLNGEDITERLWQKHLSGAASQDGTTAEIWLNYEDSIDLPVPGDRFAITFSNGIQKVVQCRDVGTVQEVYGDPSIPIWIHTFACVDPLTVLDDQALPNLKPMVNTTTGAVFGVVMQAMDPTLVLELAAGFSVGSVNFSDFSTFGDLRRSEITRQGQYALRMESGLKVRGALDVDFPVSSDWKIDQEDSRYTPSRFKIEPGANKVTSVKVTPSGDIPLYRACKYVEADGRVTAGATLEGKIFGIDQSEVFKLTAGEDISDPKLWEQTGDIGMEGSHILLNGTLVNLDARPFVFPFMISWAGVIPDEGTSYEFGFQDGDGNWIWSVSSSDFPLEAAVGDDEHTYEIYTLPTPGGIEVWGYHLHQNFAVDIDAVVATVVSVDYANNTVVLSGPWIDNTAIRFLSVDDGTERGRTRITHRNGGILELVDLEGIPGIVTGDSVTRGVAGDSVVTITPIKTVAPAGQYGLPAVSGSGVHLQTFSVQRTGQIEGYLLSEYNSMPDQTYPRALKLDVDSTEFSDGTVAGSGSGATVTFNTKYDSDKRLEMVLNYVIAGKRDFSSTCGSGGAHVVVPTDEQDPVKLHAMADRVCEIGSRNWPRVSSNMESTDIEGFPTPFDPLPLNVDPDHYRVDAPSVPFLSTKFDFRGATEGSEISNEDVFLFDMEAGEKTPAERAQEEAFRSTILSKYPISLASIGGARITSVSWDDVTLSAAVTGVSAIYGPKGQVLNLAGGIDPAFEAGIADPHVAPITLRCHADGGHFVRDLIEFQLIYPPKPVIQASVTCHYSALTNLVTYHWVRPSGGLGFDIQRLLDPDGDGIYDWTRVNRQSDNNFSLPYEPASKKIKVRAVGLCDKLSGDYVELDCILPPLPAPTLFEVAKVKPGGVINLRISPPPTGRDITGRSKFCRVFIKRLGVDDPAVTERSEYLSDSALDYIVDVPIGSKTDIWRAQVTFEDTDANDVIWIAAAWEDGFGDEGAMTVPFDATNPPVTVGILDPLTFFYTSPQNQGGTIEDDSQETPQTDFSGKFLVPLGQNNSQVKLKFEESLPDPARGFTAGPWTGRVMHSPLTDVTDDDIDNGYVIIDMERKFRYTKKKHWTCRPTKAIFIGPKIRERGQNNGEAAREAAYLVGYDSSVEAPPQIVKYQTDAVFDKHLFEFHVGIAGFANDLDTVGQGTIHQLNPGFDYTWPRLEGVEIRRYILLIHTAAFGIKGPGPDPSIAVGLNSLVDQGQVTVYNVAGTVKNIVVQAKDVGDIGKHVFGTGDIIGAITIAAGVTYYVSVIAETTNGRWSVNFSTVLNTTSGNPVTVGDAGPPGPVLFGGVPGVNWVWKEAIGYKIGFDWPTANATSIEYFWAVVYDDVYPGGQRYMDPATGLAMTLGTTEAQARFQIPGPHTFVRVRRATMDPQFVTDGVRVKVWAVNQVAGVLTEALVGDRVVSSRLIPGSDAGGPAVDVGPPDIPTGIVRFKNGTLLSRLKPGANNYETVIQYEHVFFYPAGANGTTVARTFFDPDTGLDTGIWSNSTQTASFGPTGNSGFYGSNRLRGAVTKSTLPAGAISGGFDMAARAWNKIQGSTGPVAATNPVSDTAFATAVRLATYSLTGADGDFANDRDQANWVNSGAAATAIQAGLTLISTKKSLWFGWSQPTHLISAPDDLPRLVKYGYKLQAGDGSSNWFDRVNPGTPITVDANAEFFTSALDTIVASMKSDMAAVFRTNGFKGAVRAYNYIAGVLTAGPWTLYSTVAAASDDSLGNDTLVPSSLTTPVLTSQPNILKTQGMHADANANQWLSTDVVYKVVDDAGALVNYINSTNNSAIAVEATAKINIKSGHHNLPITRAQLLAAFGGPTNRNVRVYFYVNNPIGPSLKSLDSLSLPFSSIGTDLQPEDGGVPSSLNTPVIVPRKEGIRIKGIRATANNNSMRYCELVVKAVNGGGVLIGYLDPASLTGAGAAANEAAAKISISDVDDYLYKVRKDDLLAVWTPLGGTHLRAYYYATNKQGTNATPSADSVSVAISGLGTDSSTGDDAAPGSLPTPVLKWKPKGLVGRIDTAAMTGINTIKKTEVAVSSGSTSLNFADITASVGTGSADTFFALEEAFFSLGIDKAQLTAIFGATNIYCKFRFTNDLGVATSGVSNSLAVSALEDIVGGRNAVNNVDVGTLLGTGLQMADNGDFISQAATSQSTAVKSWSRIQNTAQPLAANALAIRVNSTTSIAWNQSNNSVSVYNNSWFLISIEEADGVNINGPINEAWLRAGDDHSLSLNAKAPAGGIAGSIQVYLLDLNGTSFTQVAAVISLATIASTYRLMGGKLQSLATPLAGDKVLVLDFSAVTGIDATHPLELDGVTFVRGSQIKSYSPRVKLEGVIVPGTINAVTLPDLGGFGTQQGFFPRGGGGEIIPY